MKEEIKAFYKKYEAYWPVLFFAFGFVIDIFTIERVDSFFQIGQQLVYQIIITTLVYYEFLMVFEKRSVHRFWQPYQKYEQLALQFLLGSLLSCYFLFYFKSASWILSLIFVSILMILMTINEFYHHTKHQLALHLALLTLCWSSFWIYLVPTVVGSVGVFIFLLSIVISTALLVAIGKSFTSYETSSQMRKKWLTPVLSVNAVLIILYFLAIIPPVPIALQTIGVYHGVQKVDQQYVLTRQTPHWKFWEKGDQDFRALPGDEIVVFAQVFAPMRFQDDLYWHFYHYSGKEWIAQDRIRVSFQGGRNEGYRAYIKKLNYQPGEWRVLINTAEGREVGRINFDVTLETLAEMPDIREWYYDYY